jgi:signal peptidase II
MGVTETAAVPATRGARWAAAGLVVALVLALDQGTKALVRSSIAPGEQRDVLGPLSLVDVHNRGVAFGFLGGGGVVVLVVVLGALALLVSYFARHADRPLLWLPTGLVLGGALGNLIDRFRYGQVVDFLDFHAAGWHWPAFNVADSAISIGAVLLIVEGFMQHEGRARAPS